MKQETNWQELSATSHYLTAVAVKHALVLGETEEARAGIQELIDALARSEKRALRSQLTRLMAHVIKWLTQPEKVSRSWRASIANARGEIVEIREETPSLNRTQIEGMWDRCFARAKEQAEAEMEAESSVNRLTWEEVFENEYRLD